MMIAKNRRLIAIQPYFLIILKILIICMDPISGPEVRKPLRHDQLFIWSLVRAIHNT